MSGITSVANASALVAQSTRAARVHFRFAFIPHGSNVPVDTIPITSTTAEAAAKRLAWDQFAQRQNISVEQAKQQFTLLRKTS